MGTAVGMIQPAQVLVIGTGVAGLQAIATAKRLGAVVYAADIRPDAREQAKSLGPALWSWASPTSWRWGRRLRQAFRTRMAGKGAGSP